MLQLFDMGAQSSLKINYRSSYILFERAMRKFQVRKVLYRTLFRGKGLEFEGYRSFNQEDDYNSIDWKATLRSGEKMVKQYIEERNVSVYFLVDCSNGMLFGSGSKLKAEYVAEIVCVLASLILNTGDSAGLIMFSDKEIKFVRPSNTKNQIEIIYKHLSDIKNYNGNFEIGKALEYLSNFITGSSNNIILLSDFIHLKKGFEKNLPAITTKSDLFAIMVRDKMDQCFPEGNYKFVLRDPHSKKQMVVDGQIARKKFREQALKQKDNIKEVFIKKGIDLVEFENETEFALSLSKFIKRRAEELRI
jgi:uncharacterized protein (DUF58 family)